MKEKVRKLTHPTLQQKKIQKFNMANHNKVKLKILKS